MNGGKAHEQTIVMIAKLAGEHPEKVLADYKLSIRDQLTPEVKNMWQRIAQGAVHMAVIAAIAIFSATMGLQAFV